MRSPRKKKTEKVYLECKLEPVGGTKNTHFKVIDNETNVVCDKRIFDQYGIVQNDPVVAAILIFLLLMIIFTRVHNSDC